MSDVIWKMFLFFTNRTNTVNTFWFGRIEGQGTGTCHTGGEGLFLGLTDGTDGSSLGWGLRSLLFQLFLEELYDEEAAFFLKVFVGEQPLVGFGSHNGFQSFLIVHAVAAHQLSDHLVEHRLPHRCRDTGIIEWLSCFLQQFLHTVGQLHLTQLGLSDYEAVELGVEVFGLEKP